MPLKELQHQGKVKRAERRGEGEDFPEKAQPYHEHGRIEYPHKTGKGQPQQMLCHQPQAGGPSGDQPGGKYEQGDGQGVQGVAQQDQKDLPNGGQDPFAFFSGENILSLKR